MMWKEIVTPLIAVAALVLSIVALDKHSKSQTTVYSDILSSAPWTTMGSRRPCDATSRDSMCIHNPSVAELNGNLYAAGGWGAYKEQAHFDSEKIAATTYAATYNTTTNKWSAIAPMNDPRRYHRLAVLNGKMYAIGGETVLSDGVASPHKSCESYDIASDSWTYIASMSIDRTNVGLTTANGKLYVSSFDAGVSCPYDTFTAEVYDPTANAWSALPCPPDATVMPDVAHEAMPLGLHLFAHSNQLYLISVNDADPYSTDYGKTSLTYNIEQNTWTRWNITWPGAALLPTITQHQDKLYMIGGIDSALATQSVINTMDLNGTIAAALPLPESRYLANAITAGNKLYVFGGYDMFRDDSSSVTNPPPPLGGIYLTI